MGCGKACFGRNGQKNTGNWKFWSQSLFPGTSSNPHMRSRGNPRSDLKATCTDLEAGCNDRKRAIPHPRKQRRRSLWSDILLCFLGCGIARFLSLRPASSSVPVASRSQGTNFETKIFNFRCFLALPTETSFTTPHYYPKYEVWAIENFFVVGSL